MYNTLYTIIAGLAGLLALGLMSMPAAFGAALTTEAPVLTWRRVEQVLANATPGAQAMFRSFQSFLMQQRGAVNLQFIAINDLTDDVNDLDGAVRVYAIYLKKQATATDAFYRLFNDATNSGTASDVFVTLPLLESGKEAILFFPDGVPFSDGLVHTSQTDGDGTTDSTTGDGPNGFMLVGA